MVTQLSWSICTISLVADVAAWRPRYSADQLAEQAELARDLLEWLLDPHEAARPTCMSQVRAHRFLRPVGGVLREYAKCVLLRSGDVEIDPGAVLGKGDGGTVYRSMFGGEAVAVKEIADGNEEEALAECNIMLRLHLTHRHPCICYSAGAMLRRGKLWVVTTLYTLGLVAKGTMASFCTSEEMSKEAPL